MGSVGMDRYRFRGFKAVTLLVFSVRKILQLSKHDFFHIIIGKNHSADKIMPCQSPQPHRKNKHFGYTMYTQIKLSLESIMSYSWLCQAGLFFFFKNFLLLRPLFEIFSLDQLLLISTNAAESHTLDLEERPSLRLHHQDEPCTFLHSNRSRPSSF